MGPLGMLALGRQAATSGPAAWAAAGYARARGLRRGRVKLYRSAREGGRARGGSDPETGVASSAAGWSTLRVAWRGTPPPAMPVHRAARRRPRSPRPPAPAGADLRREHRRRHAGRDDRAADGERPTALVAANRLGICRGSARPGSMLRGLRRQPAARTSGAANTTIRALNTELKAATGALIPGLGIAGGEARDASNSPGGRGQHLRARTPRHDGGPAAAGRADC